MKKTFLLIVVLVAFTSLLLADSDNSGFAIPTMDRLVANQNLNVSAANWAPTANVGEWTNSGAVTSSFEYGTTRTETNSAKISAKINTVTGIEAKLWVEDFASAVASNLATNNSQGEISLNEETYYDYTTEDDALVLGLEDQVLIEDIYGGTWKLTDLLNYRFVFNTRLPEQTNIIVTYTISERTVE